LPVILVISERGAREEHRLSAEAAHAIRLERQRQARNEASVDELVALEAHAFGVADGKVADTRLGIEAGTAGKLERLLVREGGRRGQRPDGREVVEATTIIGLHGRVQQELRLVAFARERWVARCGRLRARTGRERLDALYDGRCVFAAAGRERLYEKGGHRRE
jgi:hypothetical protein